MRAPPLTPPSAALPPLWRSPGAAAGAAAATAARRREVAGLEAALAARLDPIDWATYEPYLYANKDRAAARSQVRLALGQLCTAFGSCEDRCVCVAMWTALACPDSLRLAAAVLMPAKLRQCA